jgi:hypothetical protein
MCKPQRMQLYTILAVVSGLRCICQEGYFLTRDYGGPIECERCGDNQVRKQIFEFDSNTTWLLSP